MALAHYSPAQVSAIAQSHGAPAWLGDALGGTSVPESGGNPTATNPSSGAAGLLQIYPKAWPQLAAAGNLHDADYNIQAALYVLSQQGSSAWSGSGTWRGPAVRAGQFRFPFPKPGATGGAVSAQALSQAATGAPIAATGNVGLFQGTERSNALKALLWVVLVLGGAALAGVGASRAFGVHRPRLPVPV